MARPTLLDMAKLKGDDDVVALLDESSIDIPEIRTITGQDIKGSSFKSLVRVKLPTVGFRDANTGVSAGKSEYKLQEFECFPITPRFEIDEVVADEHPRGAAAAIADEAIAMTNAVLQHVARCVYYGTAYEPKGFPGLEDLIPTRNVIDAGGSGNTQTAAYLFRVSEQDLQFIFGNTGRLALSDPRKETLRDGNNNPFDGWVQTLKGYIGMMVRSPRTIVKIKGITTAAPLTDDILTDAWGKFAAGKAPSGIWLNKFAMTTLIKSRTATSPTGAPPPMPSDFYGTPFNLTEAIVTGAANAVPVQGEDIDLSFKNSVIAE